MLALCSFQGLSTHQGKQFWGLFSITELGSAQLKSLKFVLGTQLPHFNSISKYKAFSCVRHFDFSGCQAWFSNVNVPQVSLSKLPGLGPGAHLSGAAPVLAPSCNPSCLLSKTPSHPELKAKSLWKEFMTNRVIPLTQALFYLPHVNYREPPGNHSPVHGHHVLFRKHNQSFN